MMWWIWMRGESYHSKLNPWKDAVYGFQSPKWNHRLSSLLVKPYNLSDNQLKTPQKHKKKSRNPVHYLLTSREYSKLNLLISLSSMIGMSIHPSPLWICHPERNHSMRVYYGDVAKPDCLMSIVESRGSNVVPSDLK